MDKELISRFRSGDPIARTAMRNHLRAVAARVLLSPQWRFDVKARTQLEKEAAAIALGCPAPDAVGFAVAALDAASLKGLERLRKAEGLVGNHPEPSLLVAVALETASAAQARQLDAHLADCASCTGHLEVVRVGLRTAASANRAADVPAPAAKQTLEQKADAPAPSRPKPTRGKKRRQQKQEAAFEIPWTPFVIGGLVIMAGLWWNGRLSPDQEIWKAASMLPDELPPTAMASQYSGATAEAILNMGSGDGDCRASASKLHMAFSREPDDYDLRYLEGLAHICAHNGPEAYLALQDVNDNVEFDELPWGFDWWYSQALVLDLQVENALWELDRIAGSDHPRSRDAGKLARDLRDAY